MEEAFTLLRLTAFFHGIFFRSGPFCADNRVRKILCWNAAFFFVFPFLFFPWGLSGKTEAIWEGVFILLYITVGVLRLIHLFFERQ